MLIRNDYVNSCNSTRRAVSEVSSYAAFHVAELDIPLEIVYNYHRLIGIAIPIYCQETDGALPMRPA